MNAEQTWNKLGAAEDDDLSLLLAAGKLPPFTSKNPLLGIKKRLLQGLILSALICCAYIVLMVTNRIWQVHAALWIVLLFTLWTMYTAWKRYKDIGTTVSSSNPLLAELRRHHTAIHQCHSLQNRVALFVNPVGAAGGFILGGTWGSGKAVEAFLSRPFVVVALIITCVSLAVIGFFLNRWMYRIFFGKHLEALQQHITELENEQ